MDLQSLIIGVGSIFVSLAFMIGPASSNYLEGILFVLVRKPYDIGDRVNIDDVNTQPDTFGGESSWIIENVDLFTTTARLGTTRELATFSNGSLSAKRIMNLNRSDKPNVYLTLKFSVDSTKKQRQTFKKRMVAFVKERPREWIKLVDFRSTRIEADLGYVEYFLILQHRESWQNLGAILSSRGQVFNHVVELQKELAMKYKAPHVPVDIRRVTGGDEDDRQSFGEGGGDSAGSGLGDGSGIPSEPKKER